MKNYLLYILVVCTFIFGNINSCFAGFITGMMLGKNMTGIDDKSGMPIYYVTDAKTGSWDMHYSGELVIPSQDGFLDLIMSSVEHATFFNGELISYTFFNNRNKNFRKRADVKGERGISLSDGMHSLNGNIYHFQYNPQKMENLVIIERKKVEIIYNHENGNYRLQFK